MAARVARIICMGKLGGYTARLGGALLEVDGCALWPSASALIMDLHRLGLEASTHIIDTRSVIETPAGQEFRRAA